MRQYVFEVVGTTGQAPVEMLIPARTVAAAFQQCLKFATGPNYFGTQGLGSILLVGQTA